LRAMTFFIATVISIPSSATLAFVC
jgi:hypothetical protein